MWDIVIVCTFFGAFIMFSFIAGLHYGSKIKRDEPIEMPNVNPIKVVQKQIDEFETHKQDALEKERIAVMLENIENYDGTGRGQKDIP